MKMNKMLQAIAFTALAGLSLAKPVSAQQHTLTTVDFTYPTIISTLVRGHTYTIAWTTTGSVPVFGAFLSLVTPDGDSGFSDEYLDITGDNLCTNSFTWTVPTYATDPSGIPFPDGRYALSAVPEDDIGGIDGDNVFFNISSEETAQPQLIRTNLPSGTGPAWVISGQSDRYYWVQQSTNLVNWTQWQYPYQPGQVIQADQTNSTAFFRLATAQ
jgi:hypothetical protein